MVNVLIENRSFTFKNGRSRSKRFGLISHRSSYQLLSDGRWWMCPVGIGVSHLSKIPTVSNGWTLLEGGIKGVREGWWYACNTNAPLPCKQKGHISIACRPEAFSNFDRKRIKHDNIDYKIPRCITRSKKIYTGGLIFANKAHTPKWHIELTCCKWAVAHFVSWSPADEVFEVRFRSEIEFYCTIFYSFF